MWDSFSNSCTAPVTLTKHGQDRPSVILIFSFYPYRFKTRNTYKRHLKTRHGKILSAQGIHVLPEDEFYKVRTSPRPKACSSEGQETEHETKWSKILLEEDFFM